MCGIYGFIGKPNKKVIKAIKTLAILNESRGKDSSGLVIATDGRIGFFKKAINSTKFYQKKTTLQLLSEYRKEDYINLIGHCRQATTGLINDDNSHPFRIGSYYFAHNGIIYNFDELQKKYKTNYQVDSQIIGYLLNRFTIKKTFEKKLEGFFTVPFFKIDEPNKLIIVKNNAGLALAYLPKNKGVFFSSELDHLMLALTKAKINASMGNTGKSKIYSFEWVKNKIVSFKVKINCKNFARIVWNNNFYNDYYPTYDNYWNNWRKKYNADGYWKKYKKNLYFKQPRLPRTATSH